MPHTPSAKKRLRQNEVRRVLNKDRTTEIKTIRKQLLRAVHDGQKDQAQQLYKQLTQRLDQAASVKTIHANAAARAKARMAKVIAGGPAAAAMIIGKGAAATVAETKPKAAAPAASAPAKAEAKPAAKPKGKKPTA